MFSVVVLRADPTSSDDLVQVADYHALCQLVGESHRRLDRLNTHIQVITLQNQSDDQTCLVFSNGTPHTLLPLNDKLRSRFADLNIRGTAVIAQLRTIQSSSSSTRYELLPLPHHIGTFMPLDDVLDPVSASNQPAVLLTNRSTGAVRQAMLSFPKQLCEPNVLYPRTGWWTPSGQVLMPLEYELKNDKQVGKVGTRSLVLDTFQSEWSSIPDPSIMCIPSKVNQLYTRMMFQPYTYSESSYERLVRYVEPLFQTPMWNMLKTSFLSENPSVTINQHTHPKGCDLRHTQQVSVKAFDNMRFVVLMRLSVDWAKNSERRWTFQYTVVIVYPDQEEWESHRDELIKRFAVGKPKCE
jgi:hypothetical protein